MTRRTLSVALAAGIAATLLLGLLVPLAGASHAPGTPGAPTPAVNRPAVAPASPFYTGMAAKVVLGAPNFTSVSLGIPANNTSFVPDPELPCVDPVTGNLWVPDFGGSRVMEFKTPFVTNEAASLVIGQPNFTSTETNHTANGLDHPAACAFDSHEDLWVSDYFNSRVLEYVPPFADGMAAHLVLGQSNFAGDAGGLSAKNLTLPTGLALDAAGNLWVVDQGNNRVLEFKAPLTTGETASVVLGQETFTTNLPGLSATNLSSPLGLWVANGVVWVADTLNGRVLGFSGPFSNGEGANYLLGQATYTGTGATGPGAMYEPGGVTTDAHGNLWVSDYNGNRVTEYLAPFSTFENASVSIGQTSLTATTAGTSATTLSNPLGVVVATNGNLLVADASNNRVLEYIPTAYHVSFHAAGLPNSVHWSTVFDGSTYAFTGPNGTVPTVNGSHVWSVLTIPGYRVAPPNGTVLITNANVTVPLTATAVTYSVTFSALGLPAAQGWTVTFGGVKQSSPNNGSISFTVANGTFAFAVQNVTGYNATPLHGSVIVNGSAKQVAVAFLTSSSSSGGTGSSTGWFSNTEALLLIIVALVVGLVIGLLFGRRRKGNAAAPAAQWTPPPPPGAPPPGGPVPPPPPPAAGGPPPGAVG